MTTSFRNKSSAKSGAAEALPWKVATSALCGICALLAFLLLQQVQQSSLESASKPVPGPRYDKAYVKFMISDHEKAIAEARDAVKQAWHPELIEMAKGIVRSREGELANMKRWSSIWWGDEPGEPGLVKSDFGATTEPCVKCGCDHVPGAAAKCAQCECKH